MIVKKMISKRYCQYNNKITDYYKLKNNVNVVSELLNY
jgi:hypothetical protein